MHLHLDPYRSYNMLFRRFDGLLLRQEEQVVHAYQVLDAALREREGELDRMRHRLPEA